MLCCSSGPEGKEAAPPPELRGELRKEKLITGAELQPSHQPPTLLHPYKKYRVIFSDHRWSGSWQRFSAGIGIADILGGCGAEAEDGVGLHGARTLLFS